jgi:Fe-S-cluster containining protein
MNAADFLAFAGMEEKGKYDFILDSSEKAYCLVLSMREQADGGRRCIFLMDLPSHEVRCGIYSIRPLACRTYPLALVNCEVLKKAWALCPSKAWDLNLLDLASWREDLSRSQMEYALYAFVVASWNEEKLKQPPLERLDFRPFLDFLIATYRRIEEVRMSIAEKDWLEIWNQRPRPTATGLNSLSLGDGQAGAAERWNWWIKSIQEAVSESIQNTGCHDVGAENSAVEMLV